MNLNIYDINIGDYFWLPKKAKESYSSFFGVFRVLKMGIGKYSEQFFNDNINNNLNHSYWLSIQDANFIDNIRRNNEKAANNDNLYLYDHEPLNEEEKQIQGLSLNPIRLINLGFVPISWETTPNVIYWINDRILLQENEYNYFVYLIYPYNLYLNIDYNEKIKNTLRFHWYYNNHCIFEGYYGEPISFKSKPINYYRLKTFKDFPKTISFGEINFVHELQSLFYNKIKRPLKIQPF